MVLEILFLDHHKGIVWFSQIDLPDVKDKLPYKQKKPYHYYFE